MSDDPTIDRDDGRALASEYVLGVLDARQRLEFERRLALEPALRAEVIFWEQQLGVLALNVKPVEPPSRTWANIEAALNSPGQARHGGLWHSLVFWRWAAVASAAVAAVSIATLVMIGRAPVPGAPLVAQLDVSGGKPGFVAAIDPSGHALTIVPASVTDVNQRVLELWLIAPGDRPRSLGLIEPGRPVHINLPADLTRRISVNATLAVSLEPPGGSPTGLPTGPVIANGKLTNL